MLMVKCELIRDHFQNAKQYQINPLLHSVDISGMIVAFYRGGARDHAEG